MARKKQLGEMLKESNLISEEQIQEALRTQKRSGGRLGQVLISLGYVTEQDIINVLEFQLGIEQVDLNSVQITNDLLKFIPENIIRQYKVLPLGKDGGTLKVAMADPLNIFAIDDIKVATGLEVQPVVTSEKDMDDYVDRLLGVEEIMNEEFQTGFEDDVDVSSPGIFDLSQGQQGAAEAPVVKLVNTIINQAVNKKASDIHIEPREKKVIIRLRVDGILRDLTKVPKQIHPSLVSRVKIMAQMDIAEKRLPQDGRIQINIQKKSIDLRISTLPTVFGEKVVMRILDKSQALLGIDQLGFLPDNKKRFEDIIRSSYGIFLVTGPTGSGKTTTLYAALNEISSPEKNIVTIEDPVEYVINDINQTQVNTKSGYTFATGLRSILRQDPDVIMVGEIRDGETASIAARAATTGHMVLSTLHTNDAAGAVARLIDMGVEPYLVSSSVVGIVAQRLVRRICSKCSASYQLDDKDPVHAFLGLAAGQTMELFKGKGCGYCDNTGYKGRLAIHEVLIFNQKLRGMIVDPQGRDRLKVEAMAQGMKTLRMDGIEKARQGLTTIGEVMRVAYVDEG